MHPQGLTRGRAAGPISPGPVPPRAANPRGAGTIEGPGPGAGRGAPEGASLEAVARVTTAVAVAAAVATAVSAHRSGAGGFTALPALLFLASALGSALYVGMRRTADATSVAADGERVLAQGVGRGGRGLLGAHVVAVTESRVLSISARPWGAGRVAAAIRLAEVEKVESIMDFLQVEGGPTTITLKACPPPQVAELLDALRSARLPA